MDAVRADGISALRAGNARPYEFDRGSGDERRGDHWSSDNLSGLARPPPCKHCGGRRTRRGKPAGKAGV